MEIKLLRRSVYRELLGTNKIGAVNFKYLGTFKPISSEPRPTLAVVDEDVTGYRLLRNTSNSWQLTRARKFLAPRLQMPPPEATAPPSAAAPFAAKDLDLRVSKFLTDEKFIKW